MQVEDLPTVDHISQTEWLLYQTVVSLASADGATIQAVTDRLAQLSIQEEPRSYSTVATLLGRLLNRGWLTCQTQTGLAIRYYYPRFPLDVGLSLLARQLVSQFRLTPGQLISALESLPD